MKRFTNGFKIYFEGIRFWLNRPRLLRISVLPAVVDGVIFFLSLSFAIHEIPIAAKKLVQEPHYWYQYFIYGLAWIGVALALFILVIFVIFVIAQIVVFPFYDQLAAITLAEKKIEIPKAASWAQWLQKFKRNMVAMVQRTLILLILGGFFLLLTLVPVLGIFSGAAGIILLALNAMDIGFDQFHWTFSQRLAFAKANIPEVIGFAVAMGLTMSIPGLNILLMPGAIVSGSVLIAERISPIERPHS